MKNKGNIILIIIFVILVIWGFRTLFREDAYIGFYYPDASNLASNIQSKSTFNSLDACRDWVDEQVSIYNLGNSNYDYECGKNCKLQNGQKPHICEETLE